ncbi:MAG: competence/damage-inducible protein A [Deltaproteobacteria bacterium]|nr:MAG: competence/damage-inducible protein A [Deltaproteobacteria bacterium]
MARTAGIVIIGDEILSGKFADENARYLIGALRELGVALQRVSMIPDDVDDIADTVARFSDRFDLVFTSGGVGPTHDDVTMAGIARAFGVDVVVHPALADAIRAFFGPELAERNLRLAEVPAGAELIGDGGDLKWPVARIRNVYILPGVPALFRRKFESIAHLFRDVPWTVERVFARADEGALAPHLDAVVAGHPDVAVGSYPRFDEPDYRVLITLESKHPDAVRAARADLVARLGDIVVRVEES